MRINQYKVFRSKSSLQIYSLLFVLLYSASCNPDSDCLVPECEKSVVTSITVVSPDDNSGGDGTLITADLLDSSSITANSATIEFTIKKVGQCHKVIGFGHTWSSTNGTPRIDIDNFSDYGEVVTINNKAKTYMNNLSPGTDYFVRNWIAIEKIDCTIERKIYYGNNIITFRTP